MIKRFDLIRIITVKNVVWVSGPTGRPASPKDEWSVIGHIGDVLYIAKDETIAQIPVKDVMKVADYSLEKALEGIKKVRNFKDLEKYRFGGVENGSGQEKAGKTGQEGSSDRAKA